MPHLWRKNSSGASCNGSPVAPPSTGSYCPNGALRRGLYWKRHPRAVATWGGRMTWAPSSAAFRSSGRHQVAFEASESGGKARIRASKAPPGHQLPWARGASHGSGGLDPTGGQQWTVPRSSRLLTPPEVGVRAWLASNGDAGLRGRGQSTSRISASSLIRELS